MKQRENLDQPHLVGSALVAQFQPDATLGTVNPRVIGQAIGLNVWETANLPATWCHRLNVSPDDDLSEIWVNACMSAPTQRLGAALAIGKYVYYYGQESCATPRELACTCGSDSEDGHAIVDFYLGDEAETYATKLALGLLMPDHLLPKNPKTPATIRAIAQETKLPLMLASARITLSR